jgi:uncharacterized protein
MKKVIIILCLFFVNSIVKGQSNVSKIEVTGQAEIEIVPDYFEYSINLQEYLKADNEKVSIEILEKSLITAVEEIGLGKDKLTINNVNGSRRYSQDNKPNSFLESRNYVLKIGSINDINNLLPKLDNMGLANASMEKKTNKKKSDFEKELRKKAIKDAEEKANSIAESINKKIVNILVIQEGNFYGLQIENFEDINPLPMKKAFRSSFITTIPVEKIKISYIVKVTFQMK